MHQHKKILVFDKLWKRLRYKQSTELKYHSIPKSDLSSKKSSRHSQLIKLSNYNLRYISYSIPLLCIMLLLGLGVISFNPAANERIFALGNNQNETQAGLPSEAAAETEPLLEENSADEGNSLDENTTGNYDDLIAPQDNNLGSASITITATDNQYGADQNAATWVAGSGMAYRSHQVTVDVNEITGYSLKISYASGKDALRLEGDSRYFADAAGRTPENMPDNTWGFAWGAANADETTLPYYTMPQFGATSTDLATGLLEQHNAYQDTFTKKLVFGAKFGSQNLPGHYKTQVILSLTASAQEVTTTLKDLTYMHEMTPEICSSTVPGESKALIDWRDGSSYVVSRLSDGENGQGNCWMLQNLKLTKEGIETWKASHPDDLNTIQLTSKYSDVADDNLFTMPTTKTKLNTTSYEQDFGNNNGPSSARIYNGPKNAGATNFTAWKTGYGAYYSWTAANAGTSVDSGDVSSSICPKGWRLPTSNRALGDEGYKYSFDCLAIDSVTGNKIAIGKAWKEANYTNDSLSLTDASGAILNGGFYSAAGQIDTGSLGYIGSRGYYWSSTAYSNTSAYVLTLYNAGLGPSSNSSRYRGLSVRCVAPSSENLQ